MRSELSLPQKPSMGESHWMKSCKPAFGNHTTLSLNSTSRILEDKTKKKTPSTWVPPSQLSKCYLLPSSRDEKRGALYLEPNRAGVSEPSDNIEHRFHPNLGKYILYLIYFLFSCLLFSNFLDLYFVTKSSYFPNVLENVI